MNNEDHSAEPRLKFVCGHRDPSVSAFFVGGPILQQYADRLLSRPGDGDFQCRLVEVGRSSVEKAAKGAALAKHPGILCRQPSALSDLFRGSAVFSEAGSVVDSYSVRRHGLHLEFVGFAGDHDLHRRWGNRSGPQAARNRSLDGFITSPIG
jgi:hypothetical protein